jgi:hypothetical protein
MHARRLGGVGGGDTLSGLGFRASPERRRHGEERGRSFEGLADRRRVFQRRRHKRRPGLRQRLRLVCVEVARDGADVVASFEEAPRDGAALVARGSGDDDGQLLRHGLIPSSCGHSP